MAKVRTEITIEVDRIIVRSWEPAAGWCDRCASGALMVTPEHAARLSGATPRAIYRQIESGDLHFIETEKGALLVCGTSLSARGK